MSSVVSISPVGPVAAATVAFRENGGLYVTAIVKATFAFAHPAAASGDGPTIMTLAQPEPIFTREMHRMNNPTRSIVATSDLVPRMPAADVLLLGHAHAPGGSATHMQVRLVVGRGESTILEKTVLVVGDRKGSEIKPFRSMPLVYERAYGGPGCRDNPLGTGVIGGDSPPNLVDPQAPDRVVGLGPISRTWPPRSSMAPAEVRARLDRPVAEIPPGFDLRFFHAAPPDQRVSHLLGDEWIVLEGTHPEAPRVHLQLPGAQAHTRVVGGEADGRVFSLRADTLRIDADGERCVLVWRNSFPVREADLGSFRLLAGVALAGAPIAWPSPDDARDDLPPPTQVLPREMQRSLDRAAGGTIVLSSDEPEPALASTFSGTMEISDDDIESVQPDFSATTVLGGSEAPTTTPLPAFWQRTQAPGPPAAPAPAAMRPAEEVRPSIPREVKPARLRDPKEMTLDLSSDIAVLGRTAMPFSGGRGPAPGSDPSPPPPVVSAPIPGSPWDPDRLAGLPLEEASTADADALDLAGTLASPTRSPAAAPPPPPPMQPASVAEAQGAPLAEALPTATVAELPTATLAAPLTASVDAPPTASVAAPPTAPLPDPWGHALREAAEPPAPARPLPAPAPKPAEQGPAVRSALYKRFKK
jgi:hypothetical protein